MPVPEHVVRFWRALDDRVGSVEPTWWGAVVTDRRFPRIWDLNYARVDRPAGDLSLAEVAGSLLPRLADVGTDVFHVVSFHADETLGLLTELSTLGHPLSWDVVMELATTPSIEVTALPVEELAFDAEVRARVRDSYDLFGVLPDAAGQLLELEDAVVAATGKRWFGVRDEGGALVALAALVQLEDVGYLDNVATFPSARRRGAASVLTARAASEARLAGARHVSLFADADAEATLRMYERLGFREVGRVGSTRGPVASVVRALGDGASAADYPSTNL